MVCSPRTRAFVTNHLSFSMLKNPCISKNRWRWDHCCFSGSCATRSLQECCLHIGCSYRPFLPWCQGYQWPCYHRVQSSCHNFLLGVRFLNIVPTCNHPCLPPARWLQRRDQHAWDGDHLIIDTFTCWNPSSLTGRIAPWSINDLYSALKASFQPSRSRRTSSSVTDLVANVSWLSFDLSSS